MRLLPRPRVRLVCPLADGAATAAVRIPSSGVSMLGPGAAAGGVRRSPNPDAIASSALVNSLGMSQVWLPSPLAILGSVCRYW